MDSSKRRRLVAIVSLTAVLISSAARAAQEESWVWLKKSGQVADAGRAYDKAANCYAQALKQITTKDESQVLDLEALLATDYVHLSNFSLAAPLTKHILVALPVLKKSKKYDPEVLVSVKFLSEAYRQTYRGSQPVSQRQKIFNQFEPNSLLLQDLVDPSDEAMYSSRIDRTRQYIYFGEPAQADLKLGLLLKKMPKTSDLYMSTELAQAAVEWSLHKPQMMERLQHELSKKYEEGALLMLLGRAHFYAANYNESDRVIGKALDALSAKKPADLNAQIEAHQLLLNSYDDRLLFAKSEPHARKIVELVEHSKGTKSDDYNKAVNRLIFYLNNLKKVDEAKKWKAKIPNNYDWLLDDEKAKPGH
ncbi:hypothetical protein BH10CYA1_BH10CYA1_20860 [soil metagenome]